MKKSQSQIVIYQAPNKTVEVKLNAKTLWLSLQQIADLFDRDKSVISRHLNKVFKDKELKKNSVVAKNATTATDGNKRSAAFLFVDFLNRNHRLVGQNNQPIINEIGLAALTLLIAESDPTNKEMMIRLVVNMLESAG